MALPLVEGEVTPISRGQVLGTRVRSGAGSSPRSQAEAPAGPPAHPGSNLLQEKVAPRSCRRGSLAQFWAEGGGGGLQRGEGMETSGEEGPGQTDQTD